MKCQIKTGPLEHHKTDCMIVGLFEHNELSPTAKKLDKISGGYLSQLLKHNEFEGKVGQTVMLYQVPHLAAKKLLLVGCGNASTLTERDFRKVVTSSFRALADANVQTAISFLTEIPVKNQALPTHIKHTVELGFEASYQFNDYKSEKKPASSLHTLILAMTEKNQLKKCEEALRQGQAIAAGVSYTKQLANQPSNICTPTYLAAQAKALAKQYTAIKTTVLEQKDMKKLGMGALLAVAKGSAEPPKLICLEYKGSKKKQAPIAIVGKGITFDTGGISLKPAEAMVGMKYDMCGAATVLGTLKAAAELELPIHLVGLIASAENMPSGTGCKPEDIVTSLSGQTIEIMNTDAEGRLVLCDALTYCERFKPDAVIDIATLTGAVVIALGHHATGLMTNNQALGNELLQAGMESYDRAWQLPLWEDYQEQLRSPFADMSNVGGRPAGTITAACFLSRFAKKFHWAHLDVAGTAAMMGGSDRYATGRPVPMLMQFLINRCKN